MVDVKALQEERTKLFYDVYDGKKPKRIPITTVIYAEAAAPYAGVELKKAQWDPTYSEAYIDKIAADIPTDKAAIGAAPRIAPFYEMLQAKAIKMGENYSMQHPEVYSLEADEYDAFIADPYKCLMDICMPKLYPALAGDKGSAMLNLLKAYQIRADFVAKQGAYAAAAVNKYGFALLPPGGFTEAPLDFVADFIRSFSNTMSDLRRYPDKVAAACEAATPHMIKCGLVPTSSKFGRTFIPLHMAPFMNRKLFEKFYWPSFKALLDGLAAGGAECRIFIENDWTPHFDYILDFPGCAELQFEYGDPKEIQQKFKGRHIMSGMFPITMLQTHTKQQCIDFAKMLMDTFGPDGNFIFNTDKGIYSIKEPIATNVKAVFEYVRDNGSY